MNKILPLIFLAAGGLFIFLGVVGEGVAYYVIGGICILFGFSGVAAMLGRRESDKKYFSEKGVYSVIGGSVTPLTTLPGNGSINAIAESFGYGLEEFDTVIMHERFNCIAYKKGTRAIIFVMTDDGKPVTFNEIMKCANRVDWGFEEKQAAWELENSGKNR